MKAELFGLIACVDLFAGSQAGATTYNVNISDVLGTGSLTVAVTTDGTIGVLRQKMALVNVEIAKRSDHANTQTCRN